ncbi:hypothetical protein D9M68_924510 [compost metagenome]
MGIVRVEHQVVDVEQHTLAARAELGDQAVDLVAIARAADDQHIRGIGDLVETRTVGQEEVAG